MRAEKRHRTGQEPPAIHAEGRKIEGILEALIPHHVWPLWFVRIFDDGAGVHDTGRTECGIQKQDYVKKKRFEMCDEGQTKRIRKWIKSYCILLIPSVIFILPLYLLAVALSCDNYFSFWNAFVAAGVFSGFFPVFIVILTVIRPVAGFLICLFTWRWEDMKRLMFYPVVWNPDVWSKVPLWLTLPVILVGYIVSGVLAVLVFITLGLMVI